MIKPIQANAVNQFSKGEILYNQNDSVETVCLILKGKVQIINKSNKMLVGIGNFIGISDLYIGRHTALYVAAEDLSVYAFEASSSIDIERILSGQKDYSGLIVCSLNHMIVKLYQDYEVLRQNRDLFCRNLTKQYQQYIEIGKQTGYKTLQLGAMAQLEMDEDEEDLIDTRKITYYRGCQQIPLDVLKNYYSVSTDVALYQIEDQAGIVERLSLLCFEVCDELEFIFDTLYLNTERSLFQMISTMAIELEKNKAQSEVLAEMIDEMVDDINNLETLLVERTGVKPQVNREKMEQVYYQILMKEKKTTRLDENSKDVDYQYIKQVTDNSLSQILQYSELDEEFCKNFNGLMKKFSSLEDRLSMDDEVRKLRKKLTEMYFTLYQAVFIRDYKDQKENKVVSMFLEYGFLDETLLNEEQIVELFRIDKKDNQSGACNVYTIKEWLTLIYEGKKEPSKNEFDLDYSDTIRSLIKSNKITAAQGRDYVENGLRKLEYEIHNMFQYNMRVIFGQVSVYVPFLYQEMFVSRVSKAHITANQVNQVMNQLCTLDYSLFYREVTYVDEAKGITNERIMKEVYPDIILFPIYGSNVVMWQEISGRRRDSAGRFMLPTFSDGVLLDMIIKVCGRFRWELCRTIQGSAWNNLKIKSLTSEYCDYLQFYRKNRNLSEEAKEKLKLQIQKGRSNSRETFVIDYEAWIKHESLGGVRLNKVAREILATYCPFQKDTRETLMSRPLFDEAMARFTREQLKKSKELDQRYRHLKANKATITSELENNLAFFRDM